MPSYIFQILHLVFIITGYRYLGIHSTRMTNLS